MLYVVFLFNFIKALNMLTFNEYKKDQEEKLNSITTFFVDNLNCVRDKNVYSRHPRIVFSNHFKERINNNRDSDIKINTKDIHQFFHALISNQLRLKNLKEKLDSLPEVEDTVTQCGLVLINNPLKDFVKKQIYSNALRTANRGKELYNIMERNNISYLLVMVLTKKQDHNGFYYLFNTIIKDVPNFYFYKKEKDVLFFVD